MRRRGALRFDAHQASQRAEASPGDVRRAQANWELKLRAVRRGKSDAPLRRTSRSRGGAPKLKRREGIANDAVGNLTPGHPAKGRWPSETPVASVAGKQPWTPQYRIRGSHGYRDPLLLREGHPITAWSMIGAPGTRHRCAEAWTNGRRSIHPVGPTARCRRARRLD